MRGTYTTALLAALLGGTSAFAQTLEPAKVRQSVDANGVDLFYGTLNVSRQEASIGADGGLSYSRYWRSGAGYGAWVDNYDIHLYQVGTNPITVTVAGNAETFTGSSSFTNAQGTGSTLVRSGASGSYVYSYTTRDGAVFTFEELKGYVALGNTDKGRVANIVFADGQKLTYNYLTAQYCSQYQVGEPDVCRSKKDTSRLASVVSNFGYQLTYNYLADNPDTPEQTDDFYTVTGVSLINLTTNSQEGSSFSRQNSIDSVTDAAGRTWSYELTNNKITAIQRPGHGMDTRIDYHSGNGYVWRYTDATNITTEYNYNQTNGEQTTTIKVGNNSPSTVVFEIATQLMKRSVDELGHVTSYDYKPNGLLKKVTANDGNSVEYEYDDRGNRLKTIAHPKPGSRFSDGSAMTDVVTTARYDEDANNPKVRNQPTATIDAQDKQTDYSYDGGTGLVLSVASPAAANGLRPYRVFGYDTATSPAAWGGGTITFPARVRACATANDCANTANETVVETHYADQNGNFVPVRVTTRAGDNSKSSSVEYGYDGLRNVDLIRDPLGQETRFKFKEGRELYWTLTPDPDAGGPLRNRMTMTDRYLDGAVEAVRTGTARSDSDGSDFLEVQRVQYGYDEAGRKRWEYVAASNVRTSQTEYSYDGYGRLDCTNQRMNFNNYINVFGRVGVCELSEPGDWGDDRITRNEYDAAGRIIRAYVGYRTENSYYTDYNWNNNNKLERVIDPKKQATTYFYDGFDRVRYTCFTTESCGNAPDYEELSYDKNGNVTIRRQRNGSTLNYSYDALNQVKDLTTTRVNNTVDRTIRYSYDNLGRTTKVGLDQYGYMDVNYAYNALNQMISESSSVGGLSVGYGYDAAGRMNFLGYGDGFYVNYDYYATGEMRRVRENGATSGSGVLAEIGIDNLGRRVSMMRGDGSHENRVYSQNGNGPWMDQLTQSMYGPGSVTRNFAYNPVGQIINRSASDDRYAWTQNSNVDRTYDVNGRNQYTRSGNIGMGYDLRGNLTTAPSPVAGSNNDPGGATSFSYNLQNMLVLFDGKAFNYDAIGRLTMDADANRLFGYAGDRLLTEREYGGRFMNRYVYGPDEAPLVMYDGGGTGSKRYLVTDERGSVTALTNGQGSLEFVNSYDDYGIPNSNFAGRFGYTGQAWNTSLRMWNYKARIYSPTLGRFMQNDPIGYGDGLNMYNYVGNDPINKTDPSGATAREVLPGARPRKEGVSGSVTSTSGSVTVTAGSAGSAGHSGSSAGLLYNASGGRTGTVGEALNGQQRAQDIVVASNCNATCRANLREQERTKWVVNDRRYILNPYYNDPAPWLNLQTAITIPPLIGVAAATVPLLPGLLGPSGPVFGDTAFGATSQGYFNSGFYRAGFGRGLGQANFRVGIGSSKWDIFSVSIPK